MIGSQFFKTTNFFKDFTGHLDGYKKLKGDKVNFNKGDFIVFLIPNKKLFGIKYFDEDVNVELNNATNDYINGIINLKSKTKFDSKIVYKSLHKEILDSISDVIILLYNDVDYRIGNLKLDKLASICYKEVPYTDTSKEVKIMYLSYPNGYKRYFTYRNDCRLNPITYVVNSLKANIRKDCSDWFLFSTKWCIDNIKDATVHTHKENVDTALALHEIRLLNRQQQQVLEDYINNHATRLYETMPNEY